MISTDKNRVTKLVNTSSYIIQEKGLEYKVNLDETKDKKFILYIDKLIAK